MTMSGELLSLDDRTILAQWGPMRLTIQAWGPAGVDLTLAAKAGKYAFSLLPRLIPGREIFRRGVYRGTESPTDPLLAAMAGAASATGQPDLGPMAAVAGTVADAVARHLQEAGAVKAIVENGGDVAIHLQPGQEAAVGVRRGLGDPEPAYRLTLRGDLQPFWGVCTSGLGGRGLTRGLADSAVCVAATSAVADAAATALGNACRVETANARQAPAETLRPDTDIPGLLVTTWRGELSEAEVDAALGNAMRYGQSLVDNGVLLGAMVCLQGKTTLTEEFAHKVAFLETL